jgi:hypothetical protein
MWSTCWCATDAKQVVFAPASSANHRPPASPIVLYVGQVIRGKGVDAHTEVRSEFRAHRRHRQPMGACVDLTWRVASSAGCTRPWRNYARALVAVPSLATVQHGKSRRGRTAPGGAVGNSRLAGRQRDRHHRAGGRRRRSVTPTTPRRSGLAGHGPHDPNARTAFRFEDYLRATNSCSPGRFDAI